MKDTFLILFFTIFSFNSFAQPHAEFTLDVPDGCINNELGFLNLSIGGIVEYAWDFGDGEISAGFSPTHIFTDAGTFTITLTVTDVDGLMDSWTEDYIVHPPVADFVLAPQIGCTIPHSVFFTDQSILPDTWSWNFGDGATSTHQNPIHLYTTAGTFYITLTVVDTIFGCVDTEIDSVMISITKADIAGLEFGYFGCAPLPVDFEDGSTNLGPGEIVDWLWDFGDGETSTESNPSHIYDDPGLYTVTLSVTNSLGCTDVDIATNLVQVIGPDVNFGADTLFAACPDLTVNFTDSTIFGAPITSWIWGFGDGGSSFLQNPTHIFTDYGDYDISLTVSDIDGCSRTLVFEDYIVIRDTINPIFDTCPEDQTGSLSASCDFELPDYTLLATASDNCTDPLVILQLPIPGTIITADQFIMLQTLDESDSMASCSFTVFLIDDIHPTITCPPDQNVSFDDDCAYTLLDYTGMATATDNCLVPTISQSPMAGTIITTTQTIILTATDTAGNIITCNFDIIPVDDIAPTIICPAAISVNNDLGLCGAIVTYGTPVGLDNCTPTTTLTAGLASGSEFPIGTTTNSFEVMDGVGLSATCSFDITVIDNENPEIICPTDISSDNEVGNCGATIVYDDLEVSDNCGIAAFVQITGLASGSEFPIGITTNTFEVTDLYGNVSSCSFDITIEDTENPTIICPANIASCESVIDFNDPVVSDNCSGESFSILSGIVSGSEFPIGITTTIFEVIDASGNAVICEMTIERFEMPTVDAGEDQTMDAGFSVQLDATVSHSVSYSWSPPDGLSDPAVEDPTAAPEQTTTYSLTVTTADGCQNSDEVQVNVELEIEINNFLSPNGDGKNDTWNIKGDYLLGACQVKIVDSWGNQIYESQGYDNSWDGTIEGEQLQQGVYYYVIDCGDGSPLTGSITLIR